MFARHRQMLGCALSCLWPRLRRDINRATSTFSLRAAAALTQVQEFRPFRRRRNDRVALVIGISKYDHVDWLENAVNDAVAVDRLLKGLGFEVALLENCTQDAIIKGIGTLKERSGDRKDVVFYFCGHALQVAGTNYLVPSDGDTSFKGDLARLINFQSDVVGALAGSSNAKVFILDACRNDPFDRSPRRVIERTRKVPAGFATDLAVTRGGLGSVQAGQETLIGFAAAPGAVVIDWLDKTSINSPYTHAMLTHMPTRSITLEEMMSRVGHQVQEQTKDDPDGQQIPWVSFNFAKRRVILNPCGLEPCYELAGLGALAGALTASFVFEGSCFVGSPFVGSLFALVVGYGVWKWGRGTWWAGAISALATAATWCAAWLILEGELERLREGKTCGPEDTDLAGTIVAATLASLFALIGTLACAALTSEALWSMTAWSTTLTVASIVLAGILVATTKLPPEYLGDVKVLPAAAAWFACLGAALGYAFARHVPSGPDAE